MYIVRGVRPNFGFIRDSTKVLRSAALTTHNSNLHINKIRIIMLASVSGRTIPRRATTPRVAACAFSSMAMTLLGGRDGSGSDSGNNRNRYTGSSNRNSSCSSRSHYNYAGPGRFSQEAAHDRHVKRLTQQNSWFDRGFTVGIGGPGK